MLNYIDFEVVSGASPIDISRVQGWVLTAVHRARVGDNVMIDFPFWRDSGGAGNKMRVFAKREALVSMTQLLHPAVRAGALSLSQVKPVPDDAPLADYVYVRSRNGKANSPSQRRRLERRGNTTKFEVGEQQRRAAPLANSCKVIMFSESTGQTYDLFIKRVNAGRAGVRERGFFGKRVPVF